MILWQCMAVCPTNEHIERIWHIGLNRDGSRLFLASADDEYLVWNVNAQGTIWRDYEEPDPDALPLLEEWIVDGHITLDSVMFEDRFRIFGLHFQLPLLESRGQSLETDVRNRTLIIRDATQEQRLPFEALSGDWAFASFSEDGNVIAVVEPYYVTLFGPV